MVEFFGNSPIDALLAFVSALGIIGAGVGFQTVLLRRIMVFAKKTESSIDDVLILAVRSLGARFYVALGVWFGLRFFLTLPSTIVSVLDTGFVIFIGVQMTIAAFRVIDFCIGRYIKSLDKDHRALATTLPSLGILFKIFVAVFVFIFILSNLGVDVTTLIAGLGIGGLAVAFAFQKVLSDLFSTFVIFFDRPFSVGDTVEAGDVSGTVDNVGIKTTRVRAFTGERIVVPNEDLVNTVLRNTSDRPSRKVVLTVPISYSTSMKKISSVPDIIENIVKSHEKANFGHAKVRELGEYAVMVEVVYKAERASYAEHTEIRHQVHLQILEALAKEKIELGYPIEVGALKK